MLNQIFGNLTVLSKENRNSKNTHYNCLCVCGNKTVVSRPNLKSGHTQSCGCLNKKILKDMHTTHNQSKTPLYAVWNGIIQRCENKNNNGYDNYGGRGIAMCEEWRNSYDVFSKWAKSNGYDNGLQIDRIDNYKGYNPSNCRFVTFSENQKNKRPYFHKGRGVTFDKNRNKWIARITANYKNKVKRFMTEEEAINQRQEWERLIKNYKD